MSSRKLKLMAYADGELDGAERAEVEAWLAEDPNAARLANDFANLGPHVKSSFEASADAKAIASFDIADALMAKVAAEPAKTNVVPLKPRRTGAMVAAGVAAALALAASFALVTRGASELPIAQKAAVLMESPDGVDVDLGDNPGQSVSVFYLPSESSHTTSVVVWVDESAGEAK